MIISNDKRFRVEYSVIVFVEKNNIREYNFFHNAGKWIESSKNDFTAEHHMFELHVTSLEIAVQNFLFQKSACRNCTLQLEYFYNDIYIGCEIIEDTKINITNLADDKLKSENNGLLKQIAILNNSMNELKPILSMSKPHKDAIMKYVRANTK